VVREVVDDGPIEIVMSVVVPYTAYWRGEREGFGRTGGGGVRVVYEPEERGVLLAKTRIQVNATWDALAFVLNGIVFVMIGLQLPYVMAGIRGYGMKGLMVYGALFSVVLIVVRLVWMFRRRRWRS